MDNLDLVSQTQCWIVFDNPNYERWMQDYGINELF